MKRHRVIFRFEGLSGILCYIVISTRVHIVESDCGSLLFIKGQLSMLIIYVNLMVLSSCG